MTATPSLIILVLWLHWVSDFVLQTDEMAQGKSKQNSWLGWHVLVYSIPFCLAFGPLYAAVNLAAHFFTDYWTSRITSKLYQEKRIHDFFVVVGGDQFLHAVMLIGTLPLADPWLWRLANGLVQ